MTRLDPISSRILSQIPRLSIAEGQKQLAEAQREATTGRHADAGLTLGSRIGSTLTLRLELDAVTSDMERAKQASLRAGVTQASFSTLTQLAKDFQSMLGGARTAHDGMRLAGQTARVSLDALQTTLSTTYDGQYIFGGLMTESVPLTPYASGPRQAVIDAFTASFGFPPSDPAASALSASNIEGFLDGAFSDLFSDAQWSSTWSPASGEGPVFRLSSGSAIDLQASANAAFARSMAQAFVMVETLGEGSIGRDAFQFVADRALARISEAQLQIGMEQARIGTAESRLKLASQSLEASKGKLQTAVQALEGVDAYEAATRVNLLMTQLESSYALTGRINKLSLLSYI
jgi:flagellar hook-associated protein 3 FlgL